ncbi:MAG: hypothetical protein COZ85_03680 [Candidatus Moranbacteria bacterium CG_4_8_14_3_um_filter_34_16]|nr:MAG: hypothetical protein COZ85_03680 [Candidatus Moranbacteria bacterium CG_4_8_14_3_um_filter_34_16]
MFVAKKIAYNVLANSLSKILTIVLALASLSLITRYLGKEGFGDYATALAFLSFFSALADLGLNSSLTREISRPNASEKDIVSKIFSLRIVVSLLILLLAPFFVFLFPYSLEVKKAIVLVAISFFFSSSYQVLNGIFQKKLVMDKVALVEFLGKILQFLVIFVAVKFQMGFLWVVSSLLFYMIFNFIGVFWWSRKYLIFNFKIDWEYWKKFLKESYPIGISALVVFIYFKLDTILLSLLKTNSDVGIYNVAYKVIENITFFPAMIIGLVFPIFSQTIFSQKERFFEVSNNIYKVFWIIVIPLLVGTIFFSKQIIYFIGGPNFSQSVLVLRILIFALALIFFGNFFNSILIAGNKQNKLLKILSLVAIFNILLNLILIPKFSYLGAAFSSVFTEFLVVLGGVYVVSKELNYFPQIKNFSKIIFSGIIMVLFFFLFRQYNFLVVGIIGSILYILSLWLLGVVKSDEIGGIISIKRKKNAKFS